MLIYFVRVGKRTVKVKRIAKAKITYMAKYTKNELALEIEQLKQQLRERERERWIMKWLILIVNFNPDCSDNCLYHES